MDSLLEALKTGSAFNREQKRKRAPRAAGGRSTNFFFFFFQILTFLVIGLFPSYFGSEAELKEKLSRMIHEQSEYSLY